MNEPLPVIEGHRGEQTGVPGETPDNYPEIRYDIKKCFISGENPASLGRVSNLAHRILTTDLVHQSALSPVELVAAAE